MANEKTKAAAEDSQLRRILGDVYTFVRSSEVNKTISSFTFDHYIDEAKREIKEDRLLRSASNPNDGVGKRPSKLASLQKLEEDFNGAYERAKKRAEASDAESNESST